MILKFDSTQDGFTQLEVKKERDQVMFSLIEFGSDLVISAHISEKDLFDLIGQLLRMQSEIRKESGNG